MTAATLNTASLNTASLPVDNGASIVQRLASGLFLASLGGITVGWVTFLGYGLFKLATLVI